MHTDAEALPDGSLLEGDLCIVGAGAAGIGMAREWIGAQRTVLLLEGGGFEYEPAMQDLYDGEIVGLPYYPLHAARLHYFGGTTNHWAGLCAPFDPIDFERRDWVPYSGWPFGRDELDPFYARAQQVLELGPYDYDADSWHRREPTLVPFAFDRRAVQTKIWQISPPTRFGRRYRDEIVGARNVHLYTHANVCEVEANESATAVAGLRVRTLGGKEHRVQARHYVLACCSLQNARLLLASNRRVSAGLGNANDLVGRFFMEHLEIPSGQLLFAGAAIPSTSLYMADWARLRVQGELTPSEEMQRSHRMLNATASLSSVVPGEEARSTFQFFTPEVLDAFVRADKGDTAAIRFLQQTFANSPFARSTAGTRLFNLQTRQEQAPNPSSRVTLGSELDAMGMPRIRFDWRLTELDRHSFRAFYDVLGRELGRSGIGRARMAGWVTTGDAWPDTLSGGWHHMGTTRMHATASQGVVDANCRVHGLGNLYVAGASVFPTSGSANPTFTLLALTLRLSDHLKTRLA